MGSARERHGKRAGYKIDSTVDVDAKFASISRFEENMHVDYQIFRCPASMTEYRLLEFAYLCLCKNQIG